MKKYKSVMLYKLGRFQEDFEYLFPEIKIDKYIVETDETYHNYIECVKLKYLKKPLKSLIVICDRKNNEITKKFRKANLIENKDFMYFEDFGKIIDENLSPRKEKIISKYKEEHDIDLSMNDISNSEMLKKMIYTDSIHNINCNHPFRYAQIERDGNVWPCCPIFAEHHLGNIFQTSPKKVWHSKRARLFRLSIINKTYAFCNLNLCKLCESDINKDKERIDDLVPVDVPEQIVVAYDQTCNLRCKSCRSCSVNHNNDKAHYHVCNVMTKKLANDGWFSKTGTLVVAAQGEVFFSKAYQDILNSKKIAGLNTIIIHTNGILLTPKKLDQLCESFQKKKVKNICINISVDSITDEIYESLRPGGNMKILKRNLEYLSKARQDGRIGYISMIVVVQRANYKELADIARYAIDLKIDQLDVQTIMNYGTYTDEEFEDISMFDKNGNMKPELAEVLKDPVFKSTEINYVGNLDLFKNDYYMN